ncbi:MAG: thioredoxin domain-containing protein, partial [Planctomycetes bacterium]|nr:thioredoxin domain-containing protein [Planctomycetota bacterium]
MKKTPFIQSSLGPLCGIICLFGIFASCTDEASTDKSHEAEAPQIKKEIHMTTGDDQEAKQETLKEGHSHGHNHNHNHSTEHKAAHGHSPAGQKNQKANDLINSQSPYLLQHAYNPVDWKEWSPAAFAEAKRRDVPVIVSIGYSTCHWCHVMAHESFEDQATADIMNQHFVCVKVDREQNPEVDEIYMDTVQAMTGHGGWPLNAIVDHQGQPFFAGTYYRKEQWQNILTQIDQVWDNDRERVAKACTEISQVVRSMNDRQPTDVPADIWQTFERAVSSSFDAQHPAFGSGQPKFPSSQLLQSIFAHKLDNSDAMIKQAEQVLQAMQDAGLHERVGGGFHRYSVDAVWRVPHFEKMLYDNA